METVQLYFDPISPFVWLATKQIARIEATGVHVAIEPVLFAGMLKAHGIKGPAEVPAKRELMFRDVMRLADAQGLAFRGPPGHPFNPLLALRMLASVPSATSRKRFAYALAQASWEKGLDVSDAAVLRQVAKECDLNGEALQVAAATPEIKQQLIAATDEAIARGVFGVPTFAYQNELFWGTDRIDALLRRIGGHRIDEARLKEFLARPALAQRSS
ncbi:2-hydroxychromene-2-carboxylate isomerase [Pseudoduganella chitinolytica]|uniref:2-hydroxychromene-2-carboxylate isomerase n=1 Tax=Pseudoduganella chitinolytica TaxID=34070 RepID=A0ABY8BFG9_9BURK|nr:2-hydroxychromene-2-carboxylate isomerase [Pseudoduganella chitinolytica]WEF34666.1 2-hydroxychromene-2-carboxylate isomerase [Pseudoduganella chitinolytica]